MRKMRRNVAIMEQSVLTIGCRPAKRVVMSTPLRRDCGRPRSGLHRSTHDRPTETQWHRVTADLRGALSVMPGASGFVGQPHPFDGFGVSDGQQGYRRLYLQPVTRQPPRTESPCPSECRHPTGGDARERLGCFRRNRTRKPRSAPPNGLRQPRTPRRLTHSLLGKTPAEIILKRPVPSCSTG